MYSGPTTPPPPSSAQLRRYDPQRPGGGRSSAPVEFEGALIDPEQTSSVRPTGSEPRRIPERPGHPGSTAGGEEMAQTGDPVPDPIAPRSFEPEAQSSSSDFTPRVSDLPPPSETAPPPESSLRILAVEARLQTARAQAGAMTPQAPAEPAPAASETASDQLQGRIIQMIGLPDATTPPRIHVTA